MRRSLELVDSVLGPIDVIVRWLAGGALLVITFDLFVNSLGRYLFAMSLFGSEELARLLVVWLTFLASYLLVRRNGHICIDVVARLATDRSYRWMAAFAAFAGAITCAYLAWLGTFYARAIFASGQVMTTLDAPAGLYYLPVPVGSGLMALAFLHLGLKAAVLGEAERPAGYELAKAETPEPLPGSADRPV
jgi:TRAP-type C4-dicarboxylate transport system permease small subunit